jgi:hypothetical protein
VKRKFATRLASIDDVGLLDSASTEGKTHGEKEIRTKKKRGRSRVEGLETSFDEGVASRW